MRWACFLVWVNSITWSVKVLISKAAGRRVSQQWRVGSHAKAKPEKPTPKRS